MKQKINKKQFIHNWKSWSKFKNGLFLALIGSISFVLLLIGTLASEVTSSFANDYIVNQKFVEFKDFSITNTSSIYSISQTSQDLSSITQEKDRVRELNLILKIWDFYGTPGVSSLFTILLLSIGPFKILPVFVDLTKKANQQLRNALAFRSFALATFVSVLVILLGPNIANSHDISLAALIAATGIVLFQIALPMNISQYNQNPKPVVSPENPSLNLVISPLTFPTILTPYGIALLIIISTTYKAVNQSLITILGVVIIIMLINLICMLGARQILKILNPTILKIFSLVLAIIQLALSISFIIYAIELEVLIIQQILQN